MSAKSHPERPRRIGTGIRGLDEVLGGGLPEGRAYLVNGEPGTGKTTLALQFLLEGARQGETGMYVTLSETESELRDIAASHGWSLDGISTIDLQTSEETLKAESQYTLFHPADIELSETTRTVLETVERLRPKRVVIDSLSELRLLARDSLRYRRQILSLKHYFSRNGATILLLDTNVESDKEFALQSLAHGVITLFQLAPTYGGQRRRLRIQKIRGVRFRDGYHDFTIDTGGIVVFPRLVATDHRIDFAPESISGGIAELDQLIGGGIERGSSTLILGPSGVGKSTLASIYATTAARRGERAVIYLFDEGTTSWTMRTEAIGIAPRDLIEDGRLVLRPVNPAELSAGQFAHLVVGSVEREETRLVVIDTLNGYQNAMAEEGSLGLHMHELLSCLAQRGVITILVMAQHGIVGDQVGTEQDLSYIADTVILMRYFEAADQVRQAISVVKKRTGGHERSVRELRIGRQGLRVGERLTEFTGVLSGKLTYTGGASPLLEEEDGHRR